MPNELLGSSQIEGFGEENQSYAHVVNTIVSSAIELIDKKSIAYDIEQLKDRITGLKIIKRDGTNHEYSPDSNTLYLSSCNQKGRKYSDEEMVIISAHELMHVVSTSETGDYFYETYPGFDEFFTEYLSFIAIMRVGGINLESYYRHEVKGYFGNNHDINFMKKLSDIVGFNQLLTVYLNRDLDGVKKIVGPETLTSLNDYYTYFYNLSNLIGQPLKEFNITLEDPLMVPQKQIIANYVNKNNQNIAALAQPSTTTSR